MWELFSYGVIHLWLEMAGMQTIGQNTVAILKWQAGIPELISPENSDETLTFKDLLEIDGTITFHQKNLQVLAIELFRCKNNLSDLTNEIFIREQKTITTRKTSFFRSRNIRTVFNGQESLSFIGPKIWDLVPNNLKELNDLKCFREKIKHWRPTSCPCRNCRVYVQGVGFL